MVLLRIKKHSKCSKLILIVMYGDCAHASEFRIKRIIVGSAGATLSPKSRNKLGGLSRRQTTTTLSSRYSCESRLPNHSHGHWVDQTASLESLVLG